MKKTTINKQTTKGQSETKLKKTKSGTKEGGEGGQLETKGQEQTKMRGGPLETNRWGRGTTRNKGTETDRRTDRNAMLSVNKEREDDTRGPTVESVTIGESPPLTFPSPPLTPLPVPSLSLAPVVVTWLMMMMHVFVCTYVCFVMMVLIG